MPIIRQEIYDKNGLIEVREIEVEDDIQQQIIDKEAQLLQIYEEIQQLKSSSISKNKLN